MTIQTFVPELWAAELIDAVQKALVFGSPTVVNTDYEGEIAAAGDTVHINSFSDPTISSYSAGGTLTYEDLTTSDQVLVVDQSKSFSFKVDDIDKRQAKAGGQLMTKAMQRAGYKLRDTVDQFIEGLFAGVQSANALGTVQVDTAAKAYDNVLIPLKVKLDEANVPTEGRFCVMPPWMHGRLLRDDRFVRWDEAGRMNNGVQGNSAVGEAAGFTILVSNNCSLITGDDYRVSAGVSDAITMATQITEVEALRLQTTIADAVRGLLLYGAKLIRPELIATATASQT